jgi:hypothetical protein
MKKSFFRGIGSAGRGLTITDLSLRDELRLPALHPSAQLFIQFV